MEEEDRKQALASSHQETKRDYERTQPNVLCTLDDFHNQLHCSTSQTQGENNSVCLYANFFPLRIQYTYDVSALHSCSSPHLQLLMNPTPHPLCQLHVLFKNIPLSLISGTHICLNVRPFAEAWSTTKDHTTREK